MQGSTEGVRMTSTSDSPLTALVTGAGRGIGRAIALDLIAAGYRVLLTARSADQLQETAEISANPDATHILTGDVITDGERIVNEALRIFGKLDVLILNAGEGISAKLEKTSDELWQQQIALNLTAPFVMMRAALPHMKSVGFGRVVVVASVASKQGAPYIAAYCAAKHGVLGLVRAAAAEYQNTGVTINAICPGYVDTPMIDKNVEKIVQQTGRSAEEVRANMAAAQGRLLTSQEVSDAVMDLINSELTGASPVLPEGMV